MVIIPHNDMNSHDNLGIVIILNVIDITSVTEQVREYTESVFHNRTGGIIQPSTLRLWNPR